MTAWNDPKAKDIKPKDTALALENVIITLRNERRLVEDCGCVTPEQSCEVCRNEARKIYTDWSI